MRTSISVSTTRSPSARASIRDGHTSPRVRSWASCRRNLAVQGINYYVDEPAAGIAPVAVTAGNSYLGVYALDTLDLTDRLKITAGARFNRAGVSLYDLRSTALNGADVFTRINPIAGATYEVLPNAFAYASYSEANRAPTPLELGCADPARPCLIDTFLVADPPLKQVESNTTEFGLRGTVEIPKALPAVGEYFPGALTWSGGVYRTNLLQRHSVGPEFDQRPRLFHQRRLDTPRGRGGLAALWRRTPLGLRQLYDDAWRPSARPSILGAPDSPLAQAYGNGSIMVTPGAFLSSVSPHRFKAGVDYAFTPEWKVGGDVQYNAGVYMRGDEINCGARLPSYAMLNLRTSYQITPNIQVYGLFENVTNTALAILRDLVRHERHRLPRPTTIRAWSRLDRRSANLRGREDHLLMPGQTGARANGARIYCVRCPYPKGVAHEESIATRRRSRSRASSPPPVTSALAKKASPVATLDTDNDATVDIKEVNKPATALFGKSRQGQ